MQTTHATKEIVPRVIGLDLGITNSGMGVIDGGEPSVLKNSEGKRTAASIATFIKTGDRLVGEAAKRQAVKIWAANRNARLKSKLFLYEMVSQARQTARH